MEKKKTSFITKFLNVIEKGGNKLPHPATLFLILSVVIIVVSFIGENLGWTATYTGLVRTDGVLAPAEVTVTVQNLLSVTGIKHIFSTLVSNFTGFAPLGTVLVALIGIGIAERSGLISNLLHKLAVSTPERLLTAVVVFLGVMSNVASDAGYVVLPPLAAMIFLSFGRNPIAGLAAAFAGVSGGFSANLIISSLDPLLAGFTQEAARILQPEYVVDAGANWYFMAASTILIVIIGTIVTEKIVEPRLGKYQGSEIAEIKELTSVEKKAMKYAGISFIGVIAILVGLWFLLGKDLFLGTALVPIIVIVFTIPGIVYGKAVKTIESDADIMNMIAETFKTMSAYLVLVFFAAQFIGFFTYSNLGTIIAVQGANILKAMNVPSVVLIVGFVIIVAIINLFMGSASAKWAILAPVFVPMLMELGISPEFSQLAYRIGDSTTNIISPLMSYFPMIIVFMQKYDKKASIGTLVSTMLPYSIAFLIFWSVMLAGWMFLNLPIGTGAGIFLG